MIQQQYDITFEDLNPSFLYSCQGIRYETEPPHSHDFIEIGIILDGEGEFSIDDVLYPVKKGDLLLLNPNIVHQSRKNSSDEPITEFYVGFTDLHFRGMEPNRILFPNGKVLLHPKEKTFLQIARIAEAITAESCTQNPGRYFMLKAYLTQLILLLYREQAEVPEVTASTCFFESSNKKYIVEQIVDYLDKHYCEKISLDKIARNMYLSSFYISRIFKSEIGDTPINYVINLRMKKAQELLLEKQNRSIQEVAHCVGYDDAYHFSKLFKKHFGEPPSKFRNAPPITPP